MAQASVLTDNEIRRVFRIIEKPGVRHERGVSGAKTDRVELAKVLARLEAGDVLVVSRLDRLRALTSDLLNVIAGCLARCRLPLPP